MSHYQPPETGHEDLERLTKPELIKRLRWELERVSDLRSELKRSLDREHQASANMHAMSIRLSAAVALREELQSQLDAETAERVRWQAAAETLTQRVALLEDVLRERGA